jgi:hypothetical protein
VTRRIDARRGVIRHLGVSDGFHGAHPLSSSHSARTEMIFADVIALKKATEAYMKEVIAEFHC